MKPITAGFLRSSGKYAFILAFLFCQNVTTSALLAGPVQDMINSIEDGGIVVIGSGTFNETLTVNKNLTLQGVSSSATILQPAASGQRVITVASGYTLVLKNLKVTGGQLTNAAGGGVYLAGGNLTLLGAHITNNSASYGGGVFQEGGSGRVEAVGSVIQGNTATFHGGGMYVRGSASLTDTQVISNAAGNHGGGVHVDAGSAVINGGLFSGNSAGSDDNGGGINVNNGLTVTGTQFQNNTAGDSGGAVSQWNKGYVCSISAATFQTNSSKNNGGAVLAKGTLNLSDSTLSGNTVDSGGTGDAYGGGIYTESPATVTRSTFTGNQAKCTGCSGSRGGGLLISLASGDLSVSTVTDSTFDGNDGWFGGGFLASYGTLNISRCVFKNNTGGYGAGLYAFVVNGDRLLFQSNTAVNKGGGTEVSGGTITNSRFLSNNAGGGGGISGVSGYLSITGNLIITNVLLAGNSAANSFLGGGGILVEYLPATVFNTTIARPSRGNGSGITVSNGATLTVKNTIAANYATGIDVNGGTLTEDYNLFFDNGSNTAASNGGTVSSGVHSLIGQNPLLVNPGGGDYHLKVSSPCINKGTSSGAPSADLDGAKRPQGAGYDIGAYEYRGVGREIPPIELLLFD